MASVFIIFYFSNSRGDIINNKALWYAALIGSVLCVLISNSRFLILSISTAIVFLSVGNTKKTIYLVLFIPILAVLFGLYSVYFGAERVTEALSSEGIYLQLESRFLPFFILFSEYSLHNYIFGSGLGVPFEIPWFHYRENMNPFNANIDSFYLTIYAKFGVFAFVLIYLMSGFFYFGKKVDFEKGVIMFVIMMFFVSATLYHIYAIGIFFGWALCKLIKVGKLND